MNSTKNDDSVIDVTAHYEKINSHHRITVQENVQLGDKYKDELKLEKKQIQLVNQLIDTDNKFNSIKFCEIHLIKLLFDCLNHLDKYYGSEELAKIKTEIFDAEARKHYRYKQGSNNYKRVLEELNVNFIQCVFKTCENELRDFLSVGRKTDLIWYLRSKEALNIFEIKIAIILSSYIKERLSLINEIDAESEILINNYNRSRYKLSLERIKAGFKENDIDEFKQRIADLETKNNGNPYLENIYYEASKFISKYNKQLALEYYIQYIYHDLKSPSFDNKQLSKTIQKNLFSNSEQFERFQKIINNLIKDKNLNNALLAVSTIYEAKRKKIQLDRKTIDEVQQQHTGTVELLNEYLRDEMIEDETNHDQNHNNVELVIEIISLKENSGNPKFVTGINLNENQNAALELFIKNDFSIAQTEIEGFAKSRGLFKNQLIDSINESCFEILDDILIEEEDDYYTINQEYFKKITLR